MSLPMRLLLPTLVLLSACHAHPPHAGGKHGHAHRFDDPVKWAAIFDDPSRDAWQRPEAVISALKLPEDARVADVGSGTGYFSLRLARALPAGKVYAVDVEPSMVDYTVQRARDAGFGNVEGVVASTHSPRLPEKVDLVLVVDTYHHVSNRLEYFDALREQLRPGGRVVIIDFTMDSPHGPPPEHRFSAEQVKAEMVAAGYPRSEEPLGLPHQYMLAFFPNR
jgi:SAM-dependent methyltransferase